MTRSVNGIGIQDRPFPELAHNLFNCDGHHPAATPIVMAAESSKKRTRYACKCLNIQIKSSKPVGAVPPELAGEPGFTQVYVKADGISAVRAIFVLRGRLAQYVRRRILSSLCGSGPRRLMWKAPTAVLSSCPWPA